MANANNRDSYTHINSYKLSCMMQKSLYMKQLVHCKPIFSRKTETRVSFPFITKLKQMI